MTPPVVSRPARRTLRAQGATHEHLLREGILKLLAIKDSDIRLLTLEQCRDAVDKSLHAGGAFSATIPLVSLYYGGFIDVDVADRSEEHTSELQSQSNLVCRLLLEKKKKKKRK